MSGWLAHLGNLAAIGSLVAVLIIVRHARALAREHLKALLEISWQWAKGPEGRGWSLSDVTAARQLDFRNPAFVIFNLHSTHVLGPLSTSQNIALDAELARELNFLLQALGSLQDAIARREAFLFGDIQLYMRCKSKLERAIRSVFGSDGGEVRIPSDVTENHVDCVLQRAGLEPVERQWIDELASMTHHLHVGAIGNSTNMGLFRAHQALAAAMRERLGT